ILNKTFLRLLCFEEDIQRKIPESTIPEHYRLLKHVGLESQAELSYLVNCAEIATIAGRKIFDN
ncbi:hypothetical protein EJB05_29109, partial [Eragrostis curvula]